MWAWLRDKLWPFLKRHWKGLAEVAAIILAVLFAKKLYDVVVKSILVGVVATSRKFRVVDAKHIAVRADGTWQVWELPVGVQAQDVKAAGESRSGSLVVQVDNDILQGVP